MFRCQHWLLVTVFIRLFDFIRSLLKIWWELFRRILMVYLDQLLAEVFLLFFVGVLNARSVIGSLNIILPDLHLKRLDLAIIFLSIDGRFDVAGSN